MKHLGIRTCVNGGMSVWVLEHVWMVEWVYGYWNMCEWWNEHMGIRPPTEGVVVGDGGLMNKTTFLFQHLHNPLVSILISITWQSHDTSHDTFTTSHDSHMTYHMTLSLHHMTVMTHHMTLSLHHMTLSLHHMTFLTLTYCPLKSVMSSVNLPE